MKDVQSLRVLTHLTGSTGPAMMAIVRRFADHWLAATGGEEHMRGQERGLMARAAAGSALAFAAAAPFAIHFLKPAAALPAAFAVAGSAFLFSSTALVAWARGRAPVRMPVPVRAEPETLPAISTFDCCAGLVLFLDPQGLVTAIGGRDRDSLLSGMTDPAGRGLMDQIHVADRIGFLQALDDLRQGLGSARVTVRLEPPVSGKPRDQQFAPVRLDLTAETDAEGALARVFCQLTDSSAEERLRSEAQARTRDAECANESKSRFLAAVSHELRTPLNAILGFSDILLGEYFGKLADDRQREYVGLIRQSGAHLLSVVNTMLDMSKIEAGRYELMMEPFLAAEPIRVCEEMLSLQAREKGLTLTSRVQRDIGEIVADRRALSQVLINLVGNAIKFTDAGGVVSIDASRGNGKFVISVSDTGIGIAEDKLALIGQPFLQIQNAYTRAYEGTGLGLSLVKGLVSLHGGEFSISSEPGEGTVITVTLPDDGSGAPGAHDEPERDAPVEFPPRLGSGRIPPAQQHEGMSHGTQKAKSA